MMKDNSITAEARKSPIKCKIKITYHNKMRIDRDIDNALKSIMGDIGAIWYAQGTDMNTGGRDICFDLNLTVK